MSDCLHFFFFLVWVCSSSISQQKLMVLWYSHVISNASLYFLPIKTHINLLLSQNLKIKRNTHHSPFALPIIITSKLRFIESHSFHSQLMYYVLLIADCYLHSVSISFIAILNLACEKHTAFVHILQMQRGVYFCLLITVHVMSCVIQL